MSFGRALCGLLPKTTSAELLSTALPPLWLWPLSTHGIHLTNISPLRFSKSIPWSWKLFFLFWNNGRFIPLKDNRVQHPSRTWREFHSPQELFCVFFKPTLKLQIISYLERLLHHQRLVARRWIKSLGPRQTCGPFQEGRFWWRASARFWTRAHAGANETP
jgi:hypothetical protein